MRRVCDSQAGKEAVKQKVKSLTCSFGAQRTVVLKDGTIVYEVNSIRATTLTTCSNICKTICERPGVVQGPAARPLRATLSRIAEETRSSTRSSCDRSLLELLPSQDPLPAGARSPAVHPRGEVHRRGKGPRALQAIKIKCEADALREAPKFVQEGPGKQQLRFVLPPACG